MGTQLSDEQPQGSTGTVPARAGQALYAPTPAEQRTARTMGAWFLGTFVFSIPAFFSTTRSSTRTTTLSEAAPTPA